MKLLLLGLVALPSFAAADALDDLVRDEMKKANIPGMAVAVIKNGKPVKLKGYGYANLEHKVPVKPETVFQSGSVGKQFTASLIMLLVQDGKLKLDDPLTKFFPEGKGKWDGATVYHLLTHTSGLPDLPYGTMDTRKDYTEDELVRFLAERDVVAKPGEKWAYNNGGYVLLGVLIGRVSGKFYGDLLQERIFGPLGMSTAQIITEADLVPNRAAGYVPTDKGLKNQPWVAPKLNTTADGSLYVTLLDMVKWDAGLAAGKPLPPSALQQMWTPVKLSDGKDANARGARYGMGWALSERSKAQVVMHGGAWQGFMAFIGRVPDRKVTVVLLVNVAGAPIEPIFNKILDYVDPLKK